MSLIKSNMPKKVSFTWSDGELVKGKVEVSSLNFVMHYAAPAVWEGIRAYKSSHGKTNILCLNEHIDRLFDSAKFFGMKIPYSKAELKEACKALVVQNGGGDLYLRPIVYSKEEAQTVHPNEHKVSVDIYAFPPPQQFDKKGLRVGISNMQRGYPQFNMQAKASCNYPHLHQCQIEKRNRNLDEMLLVDNNGHIVEATVANIFVLKNGVLLTPPNDGSILPGITRQSIVKLFYSIDFRAKGMKVISDYPFALSEKKLTRADVYTADEIFLCGTLAEIVPVLEVDNRLVGSGTIGKFTKYLISEYENVVRELGHHNMSFLERIGS